MVKKYWMSPVPATDDFGMPIDDEFIDGKTIRGAWAIMTPPKWADYGCGRLGTGFGQRYRREPGTWKFLKVEG